MTAIITDPLKRIIAEFLYDEITNGADSDEYYIGIGKSSEYPNNDTTVTPIRTLREERLARANLQSIKKVTATSFVAPRYNWTSGTIYSSYSDTTAGYPANPYYVLTENNEVYICLQQGKTATGSPNTSTVQPNYTIASVGEKDAFKTADGYRWKFLFALSATRASSFLSAGWLPVERVLLDSGSANPFEIQQLNVQNYSIPGQIIGATITNGGTGYTSAPTLTISGNGTSAAATATISGGTIVKVEMNNESAAMGSGYDYADIVVSGGGGSGASLRAILSRKEGFGYDPRIDLKSSSIMMNTKPNGEENGDFIIDNDFRQIVLLRNVEDSNTGERFSLTSGKAVKYITLNSQINFQNDDIIRGTGSGAAAFVVDVDSVNVYYVQDENTGFKSFSDGELIEDSDGILDGTIAASGANNISPVNAFTGDMLYIENRARVVRSTDQTEDIKVIVTI